MNLLVSLCVSTSKHARVYTYVYDRRVRVYGQPSKERLLMREDAPAAQTEKKWGAVILCIQRRRETRSEVRMVPVFEAKRKSHHGEKESSHACMHVGCGVPTWGALSESEEGGIV